MENNKNIDKIEIPPAEELLRKIQDLEEAHAHLKEDMSKLLISGDHLKSDRQRSNSVSPRRPHRITVGGAFEGGRGPGEAIKTGFSSSRRSLPMRKETQSLVVTYSNESNRNSAGGGSAWDGDGVARPSAVKLKETQYMNILQSMGQSVHVFDINGYIIYWNRTAQNLYGYDIDEAIGKTAPEIIIEPKYAALANVIIQRAAKGESWSGEFPVRNKRWERFIVVTTVSPSRDENGTIVGVICVSTDARPFQEIHPGPSVSAPKSVASAKLGLNPQQPLQTAIASKISNLASKVSDKVKSKIKMGENSMDDEGGSRDQHSSDIAPVDHKEDALSSGASTPRGDIAESPFGVFSSIGEHFTRKPTTDSGGESENKPGIHKVLSSKAEAWMGKRGISWSWKGSEREGGSSDSRTSRFGWRSLHNDQEHESGPQISSSPSTKVESQMLESMTASNTNEASGSWSSSYSANSSGSTNSSAINKVDIDTDNLDCEILWDDLIIGEQIGQGSCGTVYHALWYGSDVAVKVFSKQEYPDDVILSFRQEVSLMKRLRHPNILLFMGAVTSPHHLCIVTEFLPRGSLFRLLQRNTTKLDWRRRVHMAMDIARGMNYLHHCHPPIVHRDLKSSNLLVDKNWTVKVGDFGLSRIKHETYLTTKTGKGTPQWMAPELLRNEQADEKSDIYSFGVVLWEITTEKIPWDSLNSMQVIGAVGFMNQRLEIPKDVDPQWASLIESCWSSEPQSRPTFQEILDKLKDLQKKLTVQFQVSRRDNNQREP